MKPNQILVAVLLCFVTASPLYGAAELIYLFDEGTGDQIASGNGAILDHSGNGYHGNPVSNPVYRLDVPPNRCGLSLNFGQSSQTRIEIPGTENGAFEMSGPFTLEAWVKRTGNLA